MTPTISNPTGQLELVVACLRMTCLLLGSQIPLTAINTPVAQMMALQVAREGIVLLKNNNTALPLSVQRVRLLLPFCFSCLRVRARQIKTIAVIGPHGQATHTMQGNYEGVAPYLISPAAGQCCVWYAVE